MTNDPIDADDRPVRIWVTNCLFKKSGFPSLGSFGQSTDNVVIMRLRTWQRLCAEIPELGRRQFEVGTEG